MQGQASRLMAQPLIMSSICIEYTHERGIGPKNQKKVRELYTDFLFPTFVHIYEQLDEASLS